ncbi:MAG: hypothetical protein JNM56_34190, partial [Planctomycetia bacterium]|nr:hypothetical protein [Planctomycetia bacterium]
AGDVAGLRQLFRRPRFDSYEQEHLFQALRTAIDVASRDPARFAATLYAQSIAFTGYLLLRTHYLAERLIVNHDDVRNGGGLLDMPADVFKIFLPRLLELQHHVAELLEAQAKTARMWELAYGKRRQNRRARRRLADQGRAGATQLPNDADQDRTAAATSRREDRHGDTRPGSTLAADSRAVGSQPAAPAQAGDAGVAAVARAAGLERALRDA